MHVEMMVQGSPEWDQGRLGIPTASNFGRITTAKTMKFSSQAQKYACELIAEADSGISANHYMSDDMINGSLMEVEGRLAYEFITGLDIIEVGMVYANPDKLYACSPDGMGQSIEGTGQEFGLEIKCPLPSTQMGYVIDNVLPSAYVQQVQGSMWICQYDHWDFFSYHPNYKHLLLRVDRDEKFISAMSDNMDKFLNLMETIRASTR